MSAKNDGDRRDLEPMVQAHAMPKKTDKNHAPGCLGEHGKCPEPVLAKGRCQAHYRRWSRDGGKDPHIDDAPVKTERGELVPFSTRVTESTMKELDRAGGGYRVGAEILEAWAKAQIAARAGGKGRTKTVQSAGQNSPAQV